MRNSKKWSTQPPDMVDCETMVYAIGNDFSCIVDVAVQWRAAGLTVITCKARRAGRGENAPTEAQALASFPTKSTTPLGARLWRLLFDVYIQLDAYSKEDFAPSMPTVDPEQFEEWRRHR